MALDMMGLTEAQVQEAIRDYVSERNAAADRARQQRERYEAELRVRGYTEEQIRRR